MVIRDDKTLQELKDEFSAKFPFLKIELYEDFHQNREGSPASKQLDSNATVGVVRTIHKEGDISVNGHLKVETFEQKMATDYGLSLQVFRRSGDIWLQTSTTDHWTLTKQNQKGEESTQY